jgi:hypothetical protein
LYILRSYTAKLHKEHILAFGLAGDSLVLPKASCPTCQKETEKVETVCLRQLWWPFRTKIGAPTRGKEIPEKFLLRRMRVDNYDSENDAITSYTQLGTDDLKPEEFPLFRRFVRRLSSACRPRRASRLMKEERVRRGCMIGRS